MYVYAFEGVSIVFSPVFPEMCIGFLLKNVRFAYYYRM